jgi:EAL domain-containing protein (putative c-di-GMP-specific phosphodiesterase class I)/GGDEF domain-containing protein
MDNTLKHIINNLDYAFQPIVNPNTGRTFGFEALLRGFEKLEFGNIDDFFYSCYTNKILNKVEILLRKKLIEKFVKIPFHKQIKLFYNYDYRINKIDLNEFRFLQALLKKHDISHDMFCIEISEKNRIESLADFKIFLNNAKKKKINIALDDFGAGYAGLEIFYYSDPNYLKFDRFLINNIDKDVKKKLFCSHILNLTKLLGVFSIAESIETINEFNVCKEIGFELIQGFFVQEPTTDINRLKLYYDNIKILNKRNRRRNPKNDAELISKEIIKLEAISINDNLSDIIRIFHKNENYHFLPVVDSNNFPIGIIHEKKLKKYLFSPFGQDLLKYKKVTDSIEFFLNACPISDINTKQEKIMELFVNNPECEGVLIIKNLKYEGFLTAKSLLNIINEYNLKQARELNPLTKLPGNILIDKYLDKVYKKKKSIFYIFYFDLDNFKPFNDKFGFRQGDRVLTLFADLLRKRFSMSNHFVGHIGGDDFFLGIEETEYNPEKYKRLIADLFDKFSNAIYSFYPIEDCNNGYYISEDRLGNITTFPLLSATAIILEIQKGKRPLSKDQLIIKIAELKKEAKVSKNIISFINLSNLCFFS